MKIRDGATELLTNLSCFSVQPLCSLCLCGDFSTTTTETQRTQRLHREISNQGTTHKGAIVMSEVISVLDDTRRLKTIEYAGLAGLDQESAKKLLDRNLTFDLLTRATLSDLVKEGFLNNTQ